MASLIRSLLLPFLSMVLLILASGLFNTFVSVRLEMEGINPEVIGLVVAALYAGILIGSVKVERLIQRWGHRRSFIAFACTIAAIVIAQGHWINPWFWGAMRLIGGVCTAGIFVVIESWVLIQSPSKLRGGILSIYLAIFYGALSLGQLLINVADPLSLRPYYIAAGLCLLSTLPLCNRKLIEPKLENTVKLSLGQIFRISPLGFVGGVISGMTLAAIYGLVPVFALEIGLSISQIGTLMAIIVFGGLSLQWPIGRWADVTDRRKVLSAASLLSAVFAVVLALIDHTSYTLLLALSWIFGGFSFTLYPISMAYTCEKVADHQIVAATGGFVLSYGIGAILGPILAPFAMQWFGSSGLFYFLAAISLSLAIFGLKKQVAAVD